MPTQAKTLNNMTKHLTQAEIEAREAAEATVLPERTITRMPKKIRGDKVATQTWKQVLKDMDGLGILDKLDADTLATYCSMQSRRQDMAETYKVYRNDIYSDDHHPDPQELKVLRDLNKDIQSLEQSILAYAKELALTPTGRAHLARRAAAAEEAGPDDDLFA